jgi:hypothetical protein
VVAVYSGTTGPCGSNTFCIERVPGRCVPVCEQLVLSLNTGFADWRTITPTAGPVVMVSPPASGWGAPPFGSSWVSEKAGDGGGAPTYSRRYELCFNLCRGFTVPAPFQIQALADGPANVFLNNVAIGGVGGWSTPTTLFVNPSLLVAGRNCFRIDVPNGGENNNPTGFAFAGTLNVLGGKCPCSPLPIAPPQPGPAGVPGFETQNADPSANG